MAGVLIILEGLEGQVSATSAELATVARRLADELGQSVSALALGASDAASQLGAYGVDAVLVAQNGAANPPSLMWQLTAAQAAVERVSPSVILLTHASAGRELGPALAFRINAGCVTDCTALRLDGGELMATKPVFGGSAIAELAVSTSVAVATLRPRAFEAAEPQAQGSSPVELLAVTGDQGRVKVLDVVRTEAAEGPRLKDARAVVSGGRGLGQPENWKYVEELADVLGAAVGATRAVTDAGWVSPSLQVGLTGASIAPDLYIAVGISGAVQHVAGISGVRNVVAINRDPDANIFKYARFGVVGDWKQVVPALTQRLKELRS